MIPSRYKRPRVHQSSLRMLSAVLPVPLSRRLVEEMPLERGIVVSYGMIRCWARKFGTAYAYGLQRKTARTTDAWHLDVAISIGWQKHWLGVPSIRTALFLTRSYRSAATPRPPGVSWSV